jgi:hypothetical protein
MFHAFFVAGIATCTAGLMLTHCFGLSGASVSLCFSTITFLVVLIWRYNSLVGGLVSDGLWKCNFESY